MNSADNLLVCSHVCAGAVSAHGTQPAVHLPLAWVLQGTRAAHGQLCKAAGRKAIQQLWHGAFHHLPKDDYRILLLLRRACRRDLEARRNDELRQQPRSGDPLQLVQTVQQAGRSNRESVHLAPGGRCAQFQQHRAQPCSDGSMQPAIAQCEPGAATGTGRKQCGPVDRADGGQHAETGRLPATSILQSDVCCAKRGKARSTGNHIVTLFSAVIN